MARSRRQHPALAGIDETGSGGVPGRAAAPVHGRADPRGAARERVAARPLADDARVRGRSGGRGAPADGDRAFRLLERRQAGGRPDAAPLHQPRRAARAAACAGSRARAAADGARIWRNGAARWRPSRCSGTRSARSSLRSARPGSTSRSARSGSSGRSRRARSWPARSAAAEDGRLEGGRAASDPSLLSEWQVYRLVDIERGPWAAFQFLVRERLREDGVGVEPDGSLAQGQVAPDPRPARLEPMLARQRAARGRSLLNTATAALEPVPEPWRRAGRLGVVRRPCAGCVNPV